MFNEGDKITAKLNFLTAHSISINYREFEVINCDKICVKIKNKIGFEYLTTVDYLADYFYLNNSINNEIIKLIENEEIEFVSFNGVTVDGKAINIQIS